MEWTGERVHETVEAQRRFFRSGKTMDVGWRLEQLKKLRAALIASVFLPEYVTVVDGGHEVGDLCLA